jgi:hypothetical protein
MGRAERVHNTTSAKRVRTTAGKERGILPQAHASSLYVKSPINSPANPVERFLGNVVRGASDTGRSYTTDIVDSITGDYEERSLQDQTLFDAFASSAMEGNLDPAFAEAGRRITQEPGRVVGEIAVEAGFMVGTMGIGAAAKGVKIGATGIKAVRAAEKSKGVVGYQRKTGLIRKGKEIKYIGDKTTTTKTWSKKKGWQTKTKNTGWQDRIERKSLGVGEKIGNRIGTTKIASPMVSGGSTIGSSGMFKFGKKKVGLGSGKTVKENTNIGYQKQYDEFLSGKRASEYVPGKGFELSQPQKKAGLFMGVGEPVRDAAKGVIQFDNTPIQFDNTPTRIGGTMDNSNPSSVFNLQKKTLSDGTIQVLDPFALPINDKGFTAKLNPETRRVANELIKESTAKINKDKGIKAARERPSIVHSKSEDLDTITNQLAGSPNSISTDKNTVIKLAKAQVLQTITEGGTKAQARSKVDDIIAWYRKETISQEKQVVKEKTSSGGAFTATLGALGTPVDDIGGTMTKYNLEESLKAVKNVKTGKHDIVSKPVVKGEHFGNYARSEGDFESATKSLNKIGGATEDVPVIKDGINVGSSSNQFDSVADYRTSLNYFSQAQIKQYDIIRNAPEGARSALAPKELRNALPKDINQFMVGNDLSMKDVQNLLFEKGYRKKIDSRAVQIRKQTEFTKGDMSGIMPYVPVKSRWSKAQIKETGISAKQWKKDEAKRLTNPQDDVTSPLTSITFEGGPRNTGSAIDLSRLFGNTRRIKNTKSAGLGGDLPRTRPKPKQSKPVRPKRKTKSKQSKPVSNPWDVFGVKPTYDKFPTRSGKSERPLPDWFKF